MKCFLELVLCVVMVFTFVPDIRDAVMIATLMAALIFTGQLHHIVKGGCL